MEENNKIKVRIVLRHDTTGGWQAVGESFLLRRGEVGLEFPEGESTAAPKIKIGDGLTTWNNLPYFAPDVDVKLPENYTWGDLFGVKDELTNETSYTDVLGLKKPSYTDVVHIVDLNENSNKIDKEVGDLRGWLTTVEQQIAALVATPPESSGTVESEVKDARIRYNRDEYGSAGDAIRAIDKELQDLSADLTSLRGSAIPDGLYYKDSQLYLTANNEIISDPVTIISGSGGGGGTVDGYVVSLKNLLDNRIISVAAGTTVNLKFNYTSVDGEGFADGNGVGILYINNAQQTVFSVPQGDYELDITKYLKNGSNNVKVQVTNSEGNYRSLSYTVNILVLSLTTNSPLMSTYNVDSVGFQYTANGSGEKTVHFLMDGKEIKTETITSSGQSRQFLIERQPDGAHILEMYISMDSEGGKIYSNRIRAGMIWYSDTTVDPIVLINSDLEEITQGEPISIPFMVFHPGYEKVRISQLILNEDGSVFSEKEPEIGRSAVTWDIQNYPLGNVTFKIVCEHVEESKIIKVNESTFNRKIYTDNLLLEFNAQDRQNIEVNPDRWSYGDIEASFENVGWNSIDGWLTDTDGQSILRLLPNSKMTIPFMPFSNNIISTGYTIEAEIATHNVSDYDSIIMNIFNNGRGLMIKSQSATLSSEQTLIATQFKEDSKIRVTFVVEQNTTDSTGLSTSNRLVYIYINGILCGVQQYAANDNFAQSNPVGITIGADSCGIDVYFIRFYNTAFTAEMQLNNFIVDRPSLKERIDTDLRNNIINPDASDVQEEITIESLKGANRYIVMQCPELPQYKGDKKKEMSMYFVDPQAPERNFRAPGCQFDVQGTSSQYYPVKNYKIAFKGGIVYDQSGEAADGFKFTENSLISETLCLKADFASSENANNVRLVELYEQITPYKMPPQLVDERVRQGVYGEPIVVFWENTDTKEIKFVGKYNMNDDKSNENVFGFVDIDISSVIPKDQQRIECWEWRNNNTAFCLFQEDSGWNEMVTDEDGDVVPAWRASFEPRFPDVDPEYDKTDALYRMMSWVVSTRTDRATGAPLSEEKYFKTRDTNWVKGKVYYSNTEGAIAPIQEKGDIISHNNSVGIDRNLFYTKMGATSYDELVGSYAFSFNQETNMWTLYKDEEIARENIDQIGLYGVSISDSTITTFAFDYKIVGEGWSTNLYDKFTEDTEEYRLSKFRNEFKDYFELDAMTFYYVFTETFLMIDNRAKNMFLTTFDGLHWFPIPYDLDTALGIEEK